MTITANKIASDIENMATSGSLPVDFRIERSQILYWIDQMRAKLIAQDLIKRKDLSNIWIQSITCIDLIEVDKSECCEVTTNCKILRTELQLPATIESNNENTIIRVTKNNGDLIPKINIFASKYKDFSKYSNKKVVYYEKNRYIYVIIDKDEEVLIEQINVDGIFDSPSELARYTSCNGNTCYSTSNNYPCSFEMANNITDMVYKLKVIPFLQSPQDTTNNANNNFDTQPAK